MILLTGATGYVGSHLLAALMARRVQVRCLARHVDRLPADVQPLAQQGDVLDEVAVRRAMKDIDTAYYLVHAMTDTADFAEVDRQSAHIFGAAAREAGVRRIVYLGGLGHGSTLSKHLSSRQEVGEVLRASGVPVVEFRASVVIGAGSLSFELARTLVDKLPCMVTPRWVRTPAQPIAIDDVVAYLIEAQDAALPQGGIFEIGGADRVSYGDLMREYARQRGLWRCMLPVPFLSPQVSSRWLSLVVPRYARVGKLLIDGVRNDTTVKDSSALTVFSVRPKGIEPAVREAIAELPPALPALRGTRSAMALIACLVICFGAAGAGQFLSFDGISAWYAHIAKPSWTPPNGVFGPVWSVLYLMMSVAAWRIWRKDGIREARLSLGLFVLQLIFNTAWTGIFFGLRSPVAALLEILVLWSLLTITTILFSARDRIAALLLLPYLGWVSFAAALNSAIAWLNFG